MNSTEEILQRAEQKCRSHGSRLTIKRKYILSGLVMSGKAMSAYELVDFCQKEYPISMSPAHTFLADIATKSLNF